MASTQLVLVICRYCGMYECVSHRRWLLVAGQKHAIEPRPWFLLKCKHDVKLDCETEQNTIDVRESTLRTRYATDVIS